MLTTLPNSAKAMLELLRDLITMLATVLVKELLDSHLLSIEHQGGHVIEVRVRSGARTEVVPCLIPE